MARRKRRKSSDGDIASWAWMLFGLAIGLSVALAIYVNDRTPAPKDIDVAAEAASIMAESPSALDHNGEAGTSGETGAQAEEEEVRFSFYDMLPNFEVIIPESEPNVAVDIEPQAIIEAGVYVLQAGSFSAFADADRRRATLAMQGIESRIQRVTIDDKSYHRVRIGPITDLDQLNVLRSRLRKANIDVLRIRLGD